MVVPSQAELLLAVIVLQLLIKMMMLRLSGISAIYMFHNSFGFGSHGPAAMEVRG